MTREELTIAILDAQNTKPQGIITGTSNWAAWVADQVILASKTSKVTVIIAGEPCHEAKE